MFYQHSTDDTSFTTASVCEVQWRSWKAMACEALSQRLAGRKQEQIESIIIEEAATTALEAAQDQLDHSGPMPSLTDITADILTFLTI